MKKIINKVAKKKIDKECLFCGTDVYEVLDCHRIIPGENGGLYTEHNTITTCANCHRKIHAGFITIDRKYFSTNGKWMLHYWEDDIEKWK